MYKKGTMAQLLNTMQCINVECGTAIILGKFYWGSNVRLYRIRLVRTTPISLSTQINSAVFQFEG